LKYRAMIPYTRPLGEQTRDGECVHQSAVDRKNFTECDYAPRTLSDFLGAGATVVNTSRIARGTPCPPPKIKRGREQGP
jgi:hypothetical protein